MMPSDHVGRTERRLATVLFCDIVGSSTLVAAHELEDAQEQLAAAVAAMRHQVERFGGIVCQTMGDGVLAAFGVPASCEDHAIRASFAADAIIGAIRWSKAQPRLKLRIGISSGEILWDASALGGQYRAPASGPPVHLAAKLQQAAPADGILLCETAATLVSDWVDLQDAGQVALGQEQHVPALRQLAVRLRPMRTADHVPLLGRAQVLDPLLEAAAGVSQGRGSVHLIVADAGMGKSRLVAELAVRGRRLGLEVVEWGLPSVRAIGAMDPVQDLVEALLGLPLPADRLALLALLGERDVDPASADALADLVLPSDSPRIPDPTARLHRAADAVAQLVRTLAAIQPVLLVIEDLHWADSDLRFIADRLAAEAEQTPLLVVATSRAAGPLGWGEPTRHDLLPLTGNTAALLLDHLMGQSPTLDLLKERLLRRSHGNPFFLVEGVRTLQSAGALRGGRGAMRRVGPVAPRLPGSVQSLLSARLDGLAPTLREILRAAAVIGPTFDVNLLAAALGFAPAAMEPHLRQLTADGYIDVTRLLPRLEYSFRHALLHEAVYAGLTRKDRRLLHGSVAALLETALFADLRGRMPALARHAHQAGLWHSAARAGMSAGQEAFLQSRAGEAVELLELTLDSIAQDHSGTAPPAIEIDVRLLLAKAAMTRGTDGAAFAHLEQALRQAEAQGDGHRQLTALGNLASHQWVHGDVGRAVEISERAVDLSRAISADGRPRPEPLSWLVGVLTENGQLRRALDVAETASQLIDVPPNRSFMQLDPGVMTQVHRARCLAMMGDTAGLARSVDAALATAERSPFPFERIYCWTYIAEIWAHQDRAGDALGLAEDALALMRPLGAILFEARVQALAGWMHIRLGDSIAGMDMVSQAARLAARLGLTTSNSLWQMYTEAAARLALGQAEAGQAILRKAQDLAEARGANLLLRRLQSLENAWSKGLPLDGVAASAPA